MILGNKGERPEVEYPCEWQYKVIGDNLDSMVKAIESTVEGFKYDLTPSNISKKGNYYSLSLVVKVENEDERNMVYEKLNEFENIKMVL